MMLPHDDHAMDDPIMGSMDHSLLDEMCDLYGAPQIISSSLTVTVLRCRVYIQCV